MGALVYPEFSLSFVVSRPLLVACLALMNPLEDQHRNAACQDHQCNAAAKVQ